MIFFLFFLILLSHGIEYIKYFAHHSIKADLLYSTFYQVLYFIHTLFNLLLNTNYSISKYNTFTMKLELITCNLVDIIVLN